MVTDAKGSKWFTGHLFYSLTMDLLSIWMSKVTKLCLPRKVEERLALERFINVICHLGCKSREPL